MDISIDSFNANIMALSKEAKTSIIAAAATLGLALLVLAVIFIVKHVKKKKTDIPLLDLNILSRKKLI